MFKEAPPVAPVNKTEGEIKEGKEYLAQFEGKAMDFISKMGRERMPCFPMADGLVGFDSERAWEIRNMELDRGRNARRSDVAESLIGMDSHRAWQIRQKLMPGSSEEFVSMTGIDNPVAWHDREWAFRTDVYSGGLIARNLTGLDNEQSWRMRERLNFSKDASQGLLISLAGLDSDRAWEMRERIKPEEYYKKFGLAESLTGLDSDRAWELREKLLDKKYCSKENIVYDKESIARSLAGLDSDRAWELREKLLNDPEVKGDMKIDLREAVFESLAGVDSDRAWKMREDLLDQGVSKFSLTKSLGGGPVTFVWRKKYEKADKKA